MAWSQTGSLRGPTGLQGLPGRGVTSTAINGNGELEITYSDASVVNLGVVKGVNGVDGKSVTINGSVANAAALPTNLDPGDAGVGYITQDDGHLHVWGGADWSDVGNITGPQGATGNTGVQGPRGTRWYVGNGAPVDGAYTDALPADLYMDLDTGAVYVFA